MTKKAAPPDDRRQTPAGLELADAVRKLATRHHAVLLANHGPVVGGNNLAAAVEEPEDNAFTDFHALSTA